MRCQPIVEVAENKLGKGSAQPTLMNGRLAVGINDQTIIDRPGLIGIRLSRASV